MCFEIVLKKSDNFGRFTFRPFFRLIARLFHVVFLQGWEQVRLGEPDDHVAVGVLLVLGPGGEEVLLEGLDGSGVELLLEVFEGDTYIGKGTEGN